MNRIETRVAQGVALLDKTLAGWDERIDLGKLDLASTCDCVLGQEFYHHPDVELDSDDVDRRSPYEIGKSELFAGERDLARAAIAHGFNAGGEIGDQGQEFDALTAEWRRVILARRGGAASC